MSDNMCNEVKYHLIFQCKKCFNRREINIAEGEFYTENPLEDDIWICKKCENAMILIQTKLIE